MGTEPIPSAAWVRVHSTMSVCLEGSASGNNCKMPGSVPSSKFLRVWVWSWHGLELSYKLE